MNSARRKSLKGAPVTSTTIPQPAPLNFDLYLTNGLENGFSPNTQKVNFPQNKTLEIQNFFEARKLDKTFIEKIGLSAVYNQDNYITFISGIQNNIIRIGKDDVSRILKKVNEIPTKKGHTMSKLEKLLNIMYIYGDQSNLLKFPYKEDDKEYAEEGVRFLAEAALLSQMYNIYSKVFALSKHTPLTSDDKSNAQKLLTEASKIMKISLISTF